MSFGERFLEFPDLFPARISGEPCGDAEVVLNCAGGPYRVSGLTSAQSEAIREKFAEFCLEASPPAPPAVELRVYSAAPEDFTRSAFPNGAYSFESDFAADAVRLAGRDFMARMEWRPGLSAAVWTPHDNEFIAYGDFENVFRVLVAHRLLISGGVLLHSSGVVIAGAAHIFFGYSGAGKTTVAQLGLDSGYEVLSDDIDLLIPGSDGFTATRSPFAGVMGRQPVSRDAYPVRGLYLLEQGGRNANRRMTQAEAVCALLARAPFVNQDPHRTDRLIENLTALVAAVPASTLTFKKSGGFWELLPRGF